MNRIYTEASISSGRVPLGHLFGLLFDLLGAYTVTYDALQSFDGRALRTPALYPRPIAPAAPEGIKA